MTTPPTKRARSAILREILSVLALGVVSLVAYEEHGRVHEQAAVIRATRPTLERATAQDRLIGQRLDLSPWLRPGGDEYRPILAWFVDLSRCNGCFDEVKYWIQTQNTPSIHRILMVGGEITKQAAARLRLLTETTVVYVTPERIQQIVGEVPSNTKLLVSGNGVVLLADARSSGQACGWVFEAQVAALVGRGSAFEIRSRGSQ